MTQESKHRWVASIVSAIFLAFAVLGSSGHAAPSGPLYTVGTLATYRAAESIAVAIAGGTGDIAELRGIAGHVGRVKSITIAKPTAPFTLTIVKRSTQDTGGTPTTPAAVSMDTSFNAAASLTCQGYTAKPTSGTTTGKVYAPVSVAATDVLTIAFGGDDTQAMAIRSGESMVLVTDTATTISYLITWTEDVK